MIGGVTRLGGLPGLPGRITLSAGVTICHVNVSRWGTLRKIPSEYGELQHLFPCKGDLYSTARPKSVIVSYNPYTNSWTRLPNIGEDTYLLKIYVGNDESYALLSDVCTSCIDSHIRSLENDLCDRAHSTFISKYKPES